MWPHTGLEIARACGDAAWSPQIEGVVVHGINVGWSPAGEGEMFVALREREFDGHAHVADALANGAPIALVCSDWSPPADLAPELRERLVVVPDTLRAFRSFAAFFRRTFSFPVIAIGGSNGKSTTKELTAAVLSTHARHASKTLENYNGWTGIPITLLSRAHATASPPVALVLEIGIDEIGAMAEHVALVEPDVAVLSALGAEHLAGLRDEETAAHEELRLFYGGDARRRQTRIFAAKNSRIREELANAREGDVITCAAEDAQALARPGVSVLGYDVLASSPTTIELAYVWHPAGAAESTRGSLPLPMAGLHNGDNFAIAIATALSLGRSREHIEEGLTTFTPPTMRCEVRELSHGTFLIDDCYNASPDSVRAALALFAAPAWKDKKKILVLGDMLDLGASSERLHAALVEPVRALAASGARVLLFGSAMYVLHVALADAGISTTFLHADGDPCTLLDAPGIDLEDAVVLVKGSRGMHLEKVVREIERRNAGVSLESIPVADAVDITRFHGKFASACVTGTNGKTTTTSLVAAIVAASGETSCRVTTLGAWVGDDQVESDLGGDAFVRALGVAASRGVKTLAIETTSHALAQGFTTTWPVNVGVFTNLSRDHLDYHGTPEHYLAAKAQLFMSLPEGGVAIFNVADPASALLDEVTPPHVRRLGYAARPPDPACESIPVALYAQEIDVNENGTRAKLLPSPISDALGGELRLALVGAMHVENALAAALAGHALGYAPDVIKRGIESFHGVPGRFEVVSRRPLVVVDYAHTPDALARTLSLARSLALPRNGKVICVFGCGGDRDPGKRITMGEVASTSADVVLLTNDNPRSEDPEKIADAVQEGTKAGSAIVERILDREAAIGRAIDRATADDIVVVAGKGHEKTQAIGDRELPFDDVDVARRKVARRDDTFDETQS